MIFINEKSTVDDAKAERDLIDIANTINAALPTKNYIDYAGNLDAKLYHEYREIAEMRKVVSEMQKFSAVHNVYIKSELENVVDNLKMDQYGIIASVLIKHRKIKSVKEFIEKVD